MDSITHLPVAPVLSTLLADGWAHCAPHESIVAIAGELGFHIDVFYVDACWTQMDRAYETLCHDHRAHVEVFDMLDIPF